MINFISKKQNDNTYVIYRTKYGINNNEIELTGVRGCNLLRTVNRLICKYNPIFRINTSNKEV